MKRLLKQYGVLFTAMLLTTACGKEDYVYPDLVTEMVCLKTDANGIGTAFIKTMMKYAVENSYSKMSVCIIKGNDNAGNLYKKLGAKHLLDFEDDFCGTVSHSEKLLWETLSGN